MQHDLSMRRDSFFRSAQHFSLQRRRVFQQGVLCDSGGFIPSRVRIQAIQHKPKFRVRPRIQPRLRVQARRRAAPLALNPGNQLCSVNHAQRQTYCTRIARSDNAHQSARTGFRVIHEGLKYGRAVCVERHNNVGVGNPRAVAHIGREIPGTQG